MPKGLREEEQEEEEGATCYRDSRWIRKGQNNGGGNAPLLARAHHDAAAAQLSDYKTHSVRPSACGDRETVKATSPQRARDATRFLREQRHVRPKKQGRMLSDGWTNDDQLKL